MFSNALKNNFIKTQIKSTGISIRTAWKMWINFEIPAIFTILSFFIQKHDAFLIYINYLYHSKYFQFSLHRLSIFLLRVISKYFMFSGITISKFLKRIRPNWFLLIYRNSMKVLHIYHVSDQYKNFFKSWCAWIF